MQECPKQAPTFSSRRWGLGSSVYPFWMFEQGFTLGLGCNWGIKQPGVELVVGGYFCPI